MTDKIKKVFDLLGIEPNQPFIMKTKNDPENAIYMKMKFDENLRKSVFYEEKDKDWSGPFENDLSLFFNEEIEIVPLPKKKKKLRDITSEEFDNWMDKYCRNCKQCPFKNIHCTDDSDNTACWVNNKDLYSDKFLDREIEVE